MFWKLTLALVAIAGMGGAAYFGGMSKAKVLDAVHYVEKSVTALESRSPNHDETPVPVPIKEQTPWDGLVHMTSDEQAAIGIKIAKVEAQTKPIVLEVQGRTAYDPDTLTKIRPRFDTLVEKVYATLGEKIKKGDPLVELHSTELAAAKSDFQSKYVQWRHDKNLLDVRQGLVTTGAIPKQVWVDTQNDEKKSRLDYTLAMDKLKILKVPEEEITPLLDPLGDTAPDSNHYANVNDKAKMTLVSPADGIVIEREVVPQNYYETSSVLMVIAPLDHLWVNVNVYELDQDKVKVGQTMEIQFPFLQEKVRGTVQFVASEVSKDTHAVKVRASIPNPDGRLKSEMIVRAMLDIPPSPGQTTIPRQAMVSSSGNEFVFVRKAAGQGVGAGEKGEKSIDRFEKRRIVVAQERHDHVVVARGLAPGEEVVSKGSLIVAQLFEDAQTVASGMASE